MSSAGAPVVVGLDASWRSVHALDWAVSDARARGVGLVLAHAVRSSADGARTAEVVMERAYRRLSHDPAAPAAETVCHRADPVELLAELSRSAAVVVVGGPEPVGRDTLTGSVGIRLAVAGAGPVAVVRGEHEVHRPPDWPVVAAMARPDPADAVLAYAFDAAEREGRPLVAVHAWPAADAEVRRILLRDKRSADVERAHLGAAMSGALAPLAAAHPEVRSRVDVALDDADRALLDRSEHAALMVLGIRRLRHRSRWDRLPVVAPLLARLGPLLGLSPLEEVTAWRSHCPVVLVPSPDDVGTEVVGDGVSG